MTLVAKDGTRFCLQLLQVEDGRVIGQILVYDELDVVAVEYIGLNAKKVESFLLKQFRKIYMV
jgi:hypothetical protein